MTDKILLDDGILPSLDERDNLMEMAEVSGRIKWFDVAKGYGFIIPDTGDLGDVLLHVSILQRSGFQSAREGARISCVAKKSVNGYQALHIHSLDLSTAPSPHKKPCAPMKILHRQADLNGLWSNGSTGQRGLVF